MAFEEYVVGQKMRSGYLAIMHLKIIEFHQSCPHQNYSKATIQNYSSGFVASVNMISSYTFAFIGFRPFCFLS